MAGDESLEQAIRQRRETMTEAERLFFVPKGMQITAGVDEEEESEDEDSESEGESEDEDSESKEESKDGAVVPTRRAETRGGEQRKRGKVAAKEKKRAGAGRKKRKRVRTPARRRVSLVAL